MKEIPLTQGQVALVDDEDYEWLTQWKWHAWWSEWTNSYYALRTQFSRNGDRKSWTTVRMHRIVIGLTNGESAQVDHINHNTLDNRRSNLRIATVAQNQQNRRLQSSNTSGHKGVSWHPHVGKWQVRIAVDGKRKHLGYYSNVEEAAAAYREAAAHLHGEFRHLGNAA